MLVVLLPLAGLSVLTAFLAFGFDARRAFLHTAVACGLLVVAFNEVLGLFGAINQLTIACGWGGAALIALTLAWRRRSALVELLGPWPPRMAAHHGDPSCLADHCRHSTLRHLRPTEHDGRPCLSHAEGCLLGPVGRPRFLSHEALSTALDAPLSRVRHAARLHAYGQRPLRTACLPRSFRRVHHWRLPHRPIVRMWSSRPVGGSGFLPDSAERDPPGFFGQE